MLHGNDDQELGGIVELIRQASRFFPRPSIYPLLLDPKYHIPVFEGT